MHPRVRAVKWARIWIQGLCVGLVIVTVPNVLGPGVIVARVWLVIMSLPGIDANIVRYLDV